MSFDDLGLGPETLRAVAEAGYTEPTPIQQQAIPYVLMGRDILGCAQTGTGKTASFTLPMIEILDAGRAKARMPRSLILTPTRELAAQIAGNFETYGKYHKLTKALIIGGESIVAQGQLLDRGVDVLIATPGRLIDHFQRGGVLLNDVKILVIDEADRMLDMGFIPDVERIVTFLPKIRQTLFFSATFPREIRRLADSFLMNPKEIHVTPKTSAAETVDHFLVRTAPAKKSDVLCDLLRGQSVKSALIFCNRKRDVDVLASSLRRHKFCVGALHGDMAQPARTAMLESFKNGDINLLVATDVAGRGLDIVGLSHVFNFDVPTHAEDYVHRIGRTGRAGLRGCAITLATGEERKYVAAITRLIGQDIPGLDGAASGDDAHDAEPSEGKQTAVTTEPEAKRPRANARPRTRRERRPRTQARDTAKDKPKAANGAPPQPQAAKQEHARSKGGRSQGRAGAKQVVAFGDNMPAFLRQPASKTTS
ncbi:MAG: DEAD/DEAH box helicase [Alphaproteobacteria bacterium]